MNHRKDGCNVQVKRMVNELSEAELVKFGRLRERYWRPLGFQLLTECETKSVRQVEKRPPLHLLTR